MAHALSKTERDRLRPVADGWHGAYLQRLTTARTDPSTTFERWIEIAWEHGLLDHVSPADPNVRSARQLMGRTLWQERGDAILYWRLLYALEHVRTSMNHTFIQGPVAQALVMLLCQMTVDSGHRSYFQPEDRWEEQVCELLMKWAREALVDKGVNPPASLLQRGFRGNFRDIPVKIDRICADGTIWLHPAPLGEGNKNALELC